MNIQAKLLGAGKIVADMHAQSAAIPVKVGAAVRHYGLLLTTRIQANASGRPGPNVVTGDYRRSWTTRFTQAGTVSESESGTNAPQARRLEYGFHGADSLGRVYDQAPLPHVGPAAGWVFPKFEEAMRKIVT